MTKPDKSVVLATLLSSIHELGKAINTIEDHYKDKHLPPELSRVRDHIHHAYESMIESKDIVKKYDLGPPGESIRSIRFQFWTSFNYLAISDHPDDVAKRAAAIFESARFKVHRRLADYRGISAAGSPT